MWPPDSALVFILHIRLFILKHGAGRGAGSELQVNVISVCLPEVRKQEHRGQTPVSWYQPCFSALSHPESLHESGLWMCWMKDHPFLLFFFWWITCFCSSTVKLEPYSFKLDTLVWKRRWAAVPAHLSCTPTWIAGAIRAAFHDPGVWFPHFTALFLPCALKEASVG